MDLFPPKVIGNFATQMRVMHESFLQDDPCRLSPVLEHGIDVIGLSGWRQRKLESGCEAWHRDKLHRFKSRPHQILLCSWPAPQTEFTADEPEGFDDDCEFDVGYEIKNIFRVGSPGDLILMHQRQIHRAPPGIRGKSRTLYRAAISDEVAQKLLEGNYS